MTPSKPVDSDDLLHIAQRLRDIQLTPQEAGLLTDLIGIATARFEGMSRRGLSSCPLSLTSFVQKMQRQLASLFFSRRFVFWLIHFSHECVRNPPAVSGQSSSIGVFSVPPAYATQTSVTTPAATPVATASQAPVAPGTQAVSAVPAAPATTLSAAPAVASPPASTAVTPAPAQPATNGGYQFFQVLPANYNYTRPSPGTPGPYYVITRGRVVGIIAGWDRASPNCIGVSGAVFRSVPSADVGKQVVEAALAGGACMLLP
ncbi:hypothetical protein BDZ89DRAFT_1145832 [Hymenopellis radicata]|nr:hypothetical protein BDZ89DRAFT_1145832 [Hymenopellis radicata]